MNRKKELAKFFAGLTAWESIVHLSFALKGEFPVSFFGIHISETLNTVQVIVPAMISILLSYYGWFNKQQSK